MVRVGDETIAPLSKSGRCGESRREEGEAAWERVGDGEGANVRYSRLRVHASPRVSDTHTHGRT